jgi:hypothetical protein
MPRVFVSYSLDSPAHLDRILALSNRLRTEGVDCCIDQYEESPEEGWPLWCERQVEESTFVLVACTETYLRRFRKREAPQVGLGGTWEGHIITQELYEAQGRNKKFIPIVFSQEDDPFVPLVLQSATRYQLPDKYDRLYRRLTGQPFLVMPGLGAVQPRPAREPVPSLPGLERKQEFYSCFISYSTKDQDFADRLYADLQAKGVRCWFAPHDIQGGRKLHEQIDEAILVYDKLLLILSEASLNSNWVKTEIANARVREEQQKREMLFPLTLAPFEAIKQWKCFDADTGIDSAREIRAYFIPDFSNWKDHDSYRKAFERLAKDLQAPAQAAGA